MPYTITIFNRDRTDKSPVTITLPKGLFWGIAVVCVVIPLALFWLATMILAPQYAGYEVGEMRQKASQYDELKELTDQQTKDIKRFQETLEQTNQQLAEATARLTITESARSESASTQESLENQVASLQKKVDFYQSFLKPVTDRNEIQCYNIQATPAKDGKSLSYSVQFLRTEQKAKGTFIGKIRYRVLSGGQVVQLADTGSTADGTDSIKFERDITERGTLKVKVPAEGSLRILDVKVSDAKGEVVGHCWKSF